jgi:hypothetical protein
LPALAAFGAPVEDVRASDFTEPEVFFRIGIDPVRIDVITSLAGLAFGPAWDRRGVLDFSGVQAPVLCRQDVIAVEAAVRSNSGPAALR